MYIICIWYVYDMYMICIWLTRMRDVHLRYIYTEILWGESARFSWRASSRCSDAWVIWSGRRLSIFHNGTMALDDLEEKFNYWKKSLTFFGKILRFFEVRNFENAFFFWNFTFELKKNSVFSFLDYYKQLEGLMNIL